jgi:class 3 adenylate cyclase/predicted ATPase
LSNRCTECSADNSPTAKFCEDCGASLRTASAAPVKKSNDSQIRVAETLANENLEGERKTVTALFADIKGSMELIEDLDPEEARAIVDPALKLMMEAAQRYGGYVAQSTGDGIFALFGAPVAHEDHPQRALHAALRMQAEVKRYADKLRADKGVNLQVRVGANTGEVVVREIPTREKHTEYLPIGHSTGVAARLQALAAPGSIAISEALRELVEGYFVLKPLGPARIKGVSEPLEIYEVTGLGPLRTRLERGAARGYTKFVGRQREMETLKHAADLAQAGHGQIVAAVAEPGVGKSRLFFEFKAKNQSGWMVLEAFSVSHGKASAYLLIDLLHGYIGITAEDDARRRRQKVLGKLLDLDRSLEDAVPYLFALLGIVEGEDPLAQMDAQVKKRRTLEAIKRVLLRESLNQPLIVMFEDLHWIDEQTQEFLNLLADSLANAKLLLLVNYRPEYSHQWGSKTYYTQLRLDPLGAESADEMLSALLGDSPDLTSLKKLIIERTEGNPFFMEEMCQAMLEDGVIARNGVVRLVKPLKSARIPATVQGVLAARVDRLPADAKQLLQTLSVIGHEFPLSLIRAVLTRSDDELNRMLNDLQLGEFIYEQPALGDTEFIFKHALTREVAYNSVLLEQRKELHGRAARAIEELFHSSIDEHYEELARHYSRCGNGHKAIKYLQLAGQQAIQRSAYAEAITFLDAALELLKTLPETPERGQQELTFQIALGTALTTTKGWSAPEVGSAYTRARQLCQQAGKSGLLFPVLWGLWAFDYMRLNCRVAYELAEELFALAHDSNDSGLLIMAYHALSNTLFALGEFPRARDHFEQSLALYDRQQHRTLASFMGGQEPGVACRAYLAATLWSLGYPAQDLQKTHDALTLAQELRSPFNLALALANAAIHHQWRGERRLAQERAEAAMTLATEHGFSFYLATGRILRGWALVEQGQTKEGIAQIRQGMAISREIRIQAHRPYHLALLAAAQGKAGRTEEGLTTVAEALDLVNKTGARYYQAELWRLRGELLLKQNDLNTAQSENCFKRAIEVANEQNAKSWELRATTSLSRLLANQGKRDEARVMLSDIYNWFAEGLDTADLKDAKALLDELSY